MAFGRLCGLQVVVFSLIAVWNVGTSAEDVLCAPDGVGVYKDLGEYGKYNCSPTLSDLLYRPVCCLPQTLAKNCTKFCLVNKDNSSICTPLEIDNDTSSFNVSKCTILAVHGYSVKDRKTMPFIYQLLTALVSNTPCNVIFVDWTACNGDSIINYPQAFGNSRLVCKCLQLFIEKKGLNLTNVHIIGHSLGAHIAGCAGRQLQGKVGRITYLDAAGPYCQDNNPVACANKGAAVFVDAIHTNGANDSKAFHLDGLGTCGKIAHSNFFVNGGMKQPGYENYPSAFPLGELTSASVTNYNTFSHDCAVYLYTITVNSSSTKFKGYTCKTANGATCQEINKTPDEATCNDSPDTEMGYYSTKPIPVDKSYYVKINETPEYCRPQ